MVRVGVIIIFLEGVFSFIHLLNFEKFHRNIQLQTTKIGNLELCH